MPYALFARTGENHEWAYLGMFDFVQDANQRADEYKKQDRDTRVVGLP
jgi:hypothetical protein